MLKAPSSLSSPSNFAQFSSIHILDHHQIPGTFIGFPSEDVHHENDPTAAKSKIHCNPWLPCRAVPFQKKGICTE